jgi:hypothetical protein
VSDQAKGDPFGEKWGNKVYKTSTHGSWTKESSAKRDEEIAKTVPTRRSVLEDGMDAMAELWDELQGRG